jgi:flagellar motor switch protein FliM
MTEVLSQDEIDQLLTAISSGDIETEEVHKATDQRKIRIWDFKRPDKFSKEQMRSVQVIHDTFARLTTTSLSAQLRSLAQVHVASVDQLTYEEFTRSIPNPTTLAIINMDPLHGSAILEVDPAITFTIIDLLFGGQGEGIKVTRELTDIESSVMEGVIVRFLGNMREAWSQVIDLRPRLGNIDTNPQFASIVPPNEMVLLVTLETKIGDVEGMMNICIPYITIDAISPKLSQQYMYSTIRRGGSTENLNIIRERLMQMEVPIVVEIGQMDIRIKDVLALQVGDVVRLPNVRVGDPFRLKIVNKPKFLCKPGVVNKKYAVQVTKKLEEITKEEFEELTSEIEE